MKYEIRNSRLEIVYKTDNLQLAKIQANWLNEQNPNIYYELCEVKTLWTSTSAIKP